MWGKRYEECSMNLEREVGKDDRRGQWGRGMTYGITYDKRGTGSMTGESGWIIGLLEIQLEAGTRTPTWGF